MENCEKFKKRFIFGMLIFIMGMAFAYFGKSLNLYDIVAVVIIVGFSIIGMINMLTYIRCLFKFKRSIR